MFQCLLGRATTLMGEIRSEMSKPEPSVRNLNNLKIELHRQRDCILDINKRILDKTSDEDLINEITSASEFMMKISLCDKELKEHIL